MPKRWNNVFVDVNLIDGVCARAQGAPCRRVQPLAQVSFHGLLCWRRVGSFLTFCLQLRLELLGVSKSTRESVLIGLDHTLALAIGRLNPLVASIDQDPPNVLAVLVLAAVLDALVALPWPEYLAVSLGSGYFVALWFLGTRHEQTPP